MYGYLYMQFRPPQIVNQAQSSLSSTVTVLKKYCQYYCHGDRTCDKDKDRSTTQEV
jgi:hypothetical protein